MSIYTDVMNRRAPGLALLLLAVGVAAAGVYGCKQEDIEVPDVSGGGTVPCQSENMGCNNSGDCCGILTCNSNKTCSGGGCSGQGASCARSSDCCGTLTCNNNGVCVGLSGCTPNGSPCSRSSDCCGGNTCELSVCMAPGSCSGQGIRCSSSSQCCGTLTCSSGFCS